MIVRHELTPYHGKLRRSYMIGKFSINQRLNIHTNDSFTVLERTTRGMIEGRATDIERLR